MQCKQASVKSQLEQALAELAMAAQEAWQAQAVHVAAMSRVQ